MPNPSSPLEIALRDILGFIDSPTQPQKVLIRAILVNYGNHCRQEESRKPTGATLDGKS